MSEPDADDSNISNAPCRNAGQPNNMGSGQNRCAARVHCLEPALAVLKHEDRTVEDVKMHERARAAGQMRHRFSSGMGRFLLQDTGCTGRNDAEI